MTIKLELYNISSILTTDNSILISAIDKFLSTYYTMKVSSFNQSQLPTYKNFFSKIGNSYYLHINQLKHLYTYLKNIGIPFQPDTVEYKQDYEHQIEDINFKEGWELREHQIPAVDFIVNNPTKYKSQLIAAPTGTGKAQPLDALIKVPGGWKFMSDMQVGTIITAKDGSSTKVTGVYPQGKTPVYRIKFIDGRSCEASDNHLWKVYINNEVKVLDTIKIKQLLEINKVYIDLIDNEKTLDIRLPLEPYSLYEYVFKDNKTCIPDMYINSSIRQRIKILQGILDNKGSVNEKGLITLPLYNHELAKQICYLIRSIGGLANIVTEKSLENENKLLFIVNIRHNNTSELFTKQEKKNVYRLKDNIKLKIKSIEYVCEKQTQCISIDHPDQLYITNDFIVTHNTVMAMNTISKLKVRTVFFILPTFIEKWIGDIRGLTDLQTEDILVIQGSKSLKQLIELSKSNSLDYKVIIFSMRTLQEFITNYENNPELIEEEYSIRPIDLIPLIQAGMLVIDESHMQFNAVFRILLHTNIKKHLGLSATLLSEEIIVRNAQNIVYPESTRYDEFDQNDHIDVYPINYTINHKSISHIKTTAYGSKSYSHTAVEKSILKNKIITEHYLNLITELIEDYYIEEYKRDDKLAIFVSTIALATLVTSYLKNKYPQYSIERYCENDPYENVIEPDIRVTTVLSAGTAIDIPNLRVVIQTVSISSIVSNLQTLGRLRKLKDRDTKFLYIYSPQIKKQVEYHYKRKEIFSGKIKSIIDRKARNVV